MKKIEAEIYKACIDSGLKCGDLVRLSDGDIGFVRNADKAIEIVLAGRGKDICYMYMDNKSMTVASVWPMLWLRLIWIGEPEGFEILQQGSITYPDSNQGAVVDSDLPYMCTLNELSGIRKRLEDLEITVRSAWANSR